MSNTGKLKRAWLVHLCSFKGRTKRRWWTPPLLSVGSCVTDALGISQELNGTPATGVGYSESWCQTRSSFTPKPRFTGATIWADMACDDLASPRHSTEMAPGDGLGRTRTLLQ